MLSDRPWCELTILAEHWCVNRRPGLKQEAGLLYGLLVLPWVRTHTWTTLAKQSDTTMGNGQTRRFSDPPGAPGWRMLGLIMVLKWIPRFDTGPIVGVALFIRLPSKQNLRAFSPFFRDLWFVSPVPLHQGKERVKIQQQFAQEAASRHPSRITAVACAIMTEDSFCPRPGWYG